MLMFLDIDLIRIIKKHKYYYLVRTIEVSDLTKKIQKKIRKKNFISLYCPLLATQFIMRK